MKKRYCSIYIKNSMCKQKIREEFLLPDFFPYCLLNYLTDNFFLASFSAKRLGA